MAQPGVGVGVHDKICEFVGQIVARRIFSAEGYRYEIPPLRVEERPLLPPAVDPRTLPDANLEVLKKLDDLLPRDCAFLDIFPV